MIQPLRALALLSAMVLARPVFAQPLPDRAPMSGVVSDGRGQPIAGALLSLRRSNSNLSVAFWGATAQSDEAGNFVFADAEEGNYTLYVEAAGYAPLTRGEIKWRAGAAPLGLTLERLLDFTLNLRAPDGSPVSSAPVYLRLRPSNVSGQMFINALSNKDGGVFVEGVKPQVYALYARAPQGYALLFDLNVIEPKTPTRTIQLQNSGALKLLASDDLARSLGGATLSLSPATAEESRRLMGLEAGGGEDFALLAAGNNRNAVVTRDGDGTLELDGLPPGVYVPRVSLPGYRFDNLELITIQAGETTTFKAVAPARRARTLNLQLRTPDDKPYTAGEVSLRILPVAANGQLGGDPPPNPDEPDDLPFFPSGPGGRRASPDARGQISLFPVKAGNYRIFAAPFSKAAGNNVPEATPVDVTITSAGATATIIVPTG